MLKKEARKIFSEKRNNIAPSDKMKWDDLLLIQFQMLELPFLSSVLSFYPLEEKGEINTLLITDYLHFKNPGLHVFYPRINPANHSFLPILATFDTAFEMNQYNIPEPVGTQTIDAIDLDAVLVPLLAFDERGNRVGYGKGYYDRYLHACSDECLKIGLSYFEAVEKLEDAGEFDVPLDICITPQKTYVF